jgi:serine/threonine protein kinase
MNQGDEPARPGPEVKPDALRTAIRSRHPGIADEIQGAINTLNKLQQIAGKGEGGPHGDDPSLATGGDLAEGVVLSAGESFGRYQIVRILGSGAMGCVYLAYDTQLQRHVALKTPFLGNNPVTVQRFYREARTAAQIRSPHVCPIYDVGQISGITYLSMAFIDGRPLSRLIAEGELGGEKRIIELTKKIASGVQKAHEHEIIHRDLKPDNILIDNDGEPIVMDFGLARRIDEDIQLTTPGRLMGTPAYMSPEQVDGDPKNIGPTTDVYSLGVVLYHMLTGQLPFRGSLTKVLRQIASAEPVRPTALNTQITTPLEGICLKMMAKSSVNRYPSMAAVVEALEKFLPHEAPKPAPRKSFWAGLWPFSRRKAEPQAPAAVSTPLKTSPGYPDRTMAHESGEASSIEQTSAHESGEVSSIEQTSAHESGEVSAVDQTLAHKSGEVSAVEQTLDPESREACAGSQDVETSNSKTINLPQSDEG